MIQTDKIQNALLHVVGWEQSSYEGDKFRLSNTLTYSESGLFFQNVHPLLTLQNLYSIAPNFDSYTYCVYDNNKAYEVGDIIKFNGFLYKCRSNCTNVTPIENVNYWEKINIFSEWLEKKTKASIQKAIMRFITEKTAKRTTQDLLENRTLFDGTGRITDTIKNQNNLVGFEIVPIRSKGITTKINKIGLQFTEPGDYEIYIMHSSNAAPIYKLHLTKIRKNAIEWFKVDNVFLPYEGLHNDAGGSWYICYFQSSIPEGSLAIRKDRDWSKGPCNACSRHEYEAWQIWSKYLEVHPFYVNEELVQAVHFDEDFNDDYEKQPIHMWDIENNQYKYDTNFGINLELTISCDITDFIIEQKMLFADVIAKQLAVDMLREFAFNANVRTNRHSINASRLDILYEVDGDSSSMKKSGLSYQLELAYKAIELSTEGMDRVCLPCINHGVKYRTI